MGDNNNSNGAGWLIAAALIGAGVAGAKANKKKKLTKKEQAERLERERLERERQARLEQERKQREYENSFIGRTEKIIGFLGKVASEMADWAEPRVADAKKNAEEMMQGKMHDELVRLTKSENSILREAAEAELQRRARISISEWIKMSKSDKPIVRSVARDELRFRCVPVI